MGNMWDFLVERNLCSAIWIKTKNTESNWFFIKKRFDELCRLVVSIGFIVAFLVRKMPPAFSKSLLELIDERRS
jgi:hypothetical protein